MIGSSTICRFGVLSMERMQLPSAASTETAHGVAFHQVQKILFCDATQIHVSLTCMTDPITFCGCLGFYIHYALLRYTKAISPTVRRTAVSSTAVHALLQPSTTSSSCCSGSKSNLGIPYPFSGSKPN
ncbi:unnamed protein product [Sphagnum troendelagicum]|uniref:Uncharacterized protein n=1 Tax=Sphagnum troendelagicum TaxID=128251 RepID=A0ABP0TNX9_9BRYO